MVECAERLRVRFPQADIRVQVPIGLPPLQADKSGLTAVVQNLLENAVKYSPEGAAVAVAVEHSAGKFRIRVADHRAGYTRQREAGRVRQILPHRQ